MSTIFFEYEGGAAGAGADKLVAFELAVDELVVDVLVDVGSVLCAAVPVRAAGVSALLGAVEVGRAGDGHGPHSGVRRGTR